MSADLMSRETAFVASTALVILMKIVCFVLGYLTIRLGYKLIDAGVRGSFKFSASLGGAKADLASVSPGLLFVFLGIFLIGYAIYVEKGIDFTAASSGPVSSEAPPDVGVPEAPSFTDRAEPVPRDERGGSGK